MKVMSEAEIAKGRRVVAIHNIRMASPYVAFVAIGAVCVSSAAIVTLSRSRQYEAEFANAPLQSGTAVVRSKFYTYSKMGGFVHLRFLFQGRQLDAGDPSGLRAIFTNVGDTVPITYRVGKSGDYVLVDWQAPPRKVAMPR